MVVRCSTALGSFAKRTVPRRFTGWVPREPGRLPLKGTGDFGKPGSAWKSVQGLAAFDEQHCEAGEQDSQQDPPEPALLLQTRDAVKECGKILTAARAAILIRGDHAFAMRAFDLRGHGKSNLKT